MATRYDYNLIVIGAGAAGLTGAYLAAASKAKVLLVERHKMGGDCLNTGCVPSKALLRTGKILSYIRRANEFGLAGATAQVDFALVMERVQAVIRQVAPHDSIDRYQSLGVEVQIGEARLTGPHQVEVGGRTYSARAILLATGARPLVPPFKGLEQIPYSTSDNLWDLRTQPKELLVLGGGPIGCELAQAFGRLGSQVKIVNLAAHLLDREDPEVAQLIEKRFQQEGIKLFNSHKALEFGREEGRPYLLAQGPVGPVKIGFDHALIALGRQANSEIPGAKELGIHLRGNGTVEANPFLQTNLPHIFVAGDLTGPYQFTHTAGHQAWYAAVNALFDPFKKFKVDYSVIPWCTFVDPEVAHVGLNETEAKQQGLDYQVTHYPLADLDRAIADAETQGFVKVLTQGSKDRILGVTIVGSHAGDLIAEFVLAMKQGRGLNQILGTIHIYPTLAEANKMAAGAWKRTHLPKGLLALVELFHRWRRS
ncbi:MAG: pyridine nucleotide-disulfide oxidoreductase [Candidatus Lambdaproteobacteria bacterium RIFOXYD1_FULL_56_27]|uniref:Pyridine nucleotide-disulfide oxidoreductase n=1 Tax=Candidatus Lambdaproteobacteria bacterium RIFOXYD2_FULL_56_26 TaxID=1817773 RepID=A0A1F6GP89_9PROT|nr:MAG: pyridine nucleotide-disulfide oxidoreductase [Candidatus Lambdaproteobacteria bacterium RIFOXYD2_FULL_56_26]OGH04086.1 MAG: pyridine nucleotide-disulfide oxidoreductase [Candidatus Lambdaproteobacteria bacterium RIFOXYC1_FULL_56_13]OGH09820.1 MAG: pyridine nucleotide-disulfide oxidoreductase [Candidatus Lambdaproteobacteria bacterium RIFOXYD1_FULL_56_27]